MVEFADREKEVARIYQDPKLTREQKIAALQAMPEPPRRAMSEGTASNDIPVAYPNPTPMTQSDFMGALERQGALTQTVGEKKPAAAPVDPNSTEGFVQKLQAAGAAPVVHDEKATPEAVKAAAQKKSGANIDTSAPGSSGGSPEEMSTADLIAALTGGASKPQYATVGTDTFQPVQRVEKGIDLGPGQEDRDTARLLSQDLERTARNEKGDAELTAIQDARRGEILAERAREAVDLEAANQDKLRDQELLRRESEWQKDVASASNAKLDPDRFWNSMDTGQQLMTFLALLVSGASSRISHSKDSFRESIEKQIDRDIEAQKAHLDSLYKKADGSRTLYDMASERYKTEEARSAAAKELAYAQISQRLARFADAAKDPARKAAMQEEQQVWEQKKLDMADQRALAQAKEVTEQSRWDPRRTVQVGGGSGDDTLKILKALKERGELTEAFLKSKGWTPDRWVGALGSYASSPEEATKLKDEYASSQDYQRRLAEMANFAATHNLADPTNSTRFAGMHADALVSYTKAKQLGSLDSGTVEVGGQVLPPAQELLRSKDNAVAAIRDAQRRASQATRVKAANATLIDGPAPENIHQVQQSVGSARKAEE